MFLVRRKQLLSIGWSAPCFCCFLTRFFVGVHSAVTEGLAEYVKDPVMRCRDEKSISSMKSDCKVCVLSASHSKRNTIHLQCYSSKRVRRLCKFYAHQHLRGAAFIVLRTELWRRTALRGLKKIGRRRKLHQDLLEAFFGCKQTLKASRDV